MAIAKLKLLNIEFPQEKNDDVLMKLIKLDNFHPELASKFVDSVHGLTVLNRENLYVDLIAKMEEANEKYNIGLQEKEITDTKINIIQADTFFCNLLEKAARYEVAKKDLQTMLDEDVAGIKQLQHIIESDSDVNLNFDDLFACQYLKIRFGRLPVAHLDRLQYYGNQEFLLRTFFKGERNCYCMYMTTNELAPKIDNIFSSLYFERIRIPEFVHGTPKDALEVLKEEDEAGKKYLGEVEGKIHKLFQDNIDELNKIYSIAKRLNQTYEAQKYVVVFGQNSSVYGFAEEEDAKKIKADFETIDGVSVKIQPATGDSRLTPPTKLKGNWFTKPFRMFVEMYGVPSYTDFDPTNFVAISYTLLFGIMFGDVGQGLVLSLVGYIAYKLKGMQLGAIGIRLGFSSAIFGLVYGSVFGYEELYHAPFHVMSPENTMPLLGIAIGLGVALIIIAILFNIFGNMKKKNYGEMLFSHNGIAGLIFYISVLLMVGDMILGLGLPVGGTFYVIGLIVIPILAVFLKEPLIHKMEGKPMFPHGFGGFFTEGFFELFEIVLSFVANTMSFLRVGGFVLSHAGMMLVVFTLAEMVGGIGYWVVLVFGNIFVMCLEGMIVGIQVLRSEFYEMFSRYYEGKGKPFTTISQK